MTQDKNSRRLEDKKVREEARELVIERIKATSNNLKICIGSQNTEYSRQEILETLKEDSELSKEIIDVQLKYLRDMASGAIYRDR